MLDHKGTKIKETERLILRKVKADDAIEMYNNWAKDEEVTKYLTWPAHNSVEISKKVIKIWIENYEDIEYYHWAIELKETHELIGTISLMNVDNHNENCEVGYCMSKEYWGKGIMTEVFSKIIKFAFEEVDFKRITARHDIFNIASGKVMEKCGLKYEGTLRKVNKDSKGILVDCKYYSILKEEYIESV